MIISSLLLENRGKIEKFLLISSLVDIFGTRDFEKWFFILISSFCFENIKEFSRCDKWEIKLSYFKLKASFKLLVILG